MNSPSPGTLRQQLCAVECYLTSRLRYSQPATAWRLAKELAAASEEIDLRRLRLAEWFTDWQQGGGTNER